MPVRSFNADDDVHEFLDSKDNVSRFINTVVRRVMDGYEPEVVVIDYQIEQLKTELAKLDNRHEADRESIEHRIAELEDRKSRFRQEEREAREHVIRDFAENFPRDFPLEPAEPTIQAKAETANLEPREFIDAVESEWSA